MIELNENSLTDAMTSCYSHFNSKVGVAFSSSERMRVFAMSLQSRQREGLVPATYYKCGVHEIFFDTGSSIRMVNASDPRSLYGHTFHTILYDPEIYDKVTLEHLESCERLYPAFGGCVKSSVEVEIDNQPLDDFLNGFQIIERSAGADEKF